MRLLTRCAVLLRPDRSLAHVRSSGLIALEAPRQRRRRLTGDDVTRRPDWIHAVLMSGLLATALAAPLSAQWLSYRDSTIPRTKDGKPDLTASAPRLDGKPDLSGVWEVVPDKIDFAQLLGPAAAEFAATAPTDLPPAISKYVLNIMADLKPEEDPSRPEAKALLQQRMAGFGKDIPTSHCQPGGVPFSTLIAPFKMVQTPRQIVMLLEDNNPPRQIYLDGRKLPDDPWPSWMGYSSGRWEGDALVAETHGFNNRSWLDGIGHPRSEAMRVVERFHRRDVGHMDVEMTFDDPKMYTRAFTIKFGLRLIPDTDVLESICAENEKDRVHLDR